MRRGFEPGYADHRAGKVRARQVWRVLIEPTSALYYAGVSWSFVTYWFSVVPSAVYLARIYARLMLSRATASLVEGTSVVIPTTNFLDRKFQFCIRAMKHSELPEEILVFQVNKGFSYSGAINKGIRSSKGKYLVVLNDDCFVTGNWLSALVKLAESNPRIGIVASKLLRVDGKSPDTGAHINLDGETVPETDNPDVAHIVNGFLGCSILIKRELIEQIGGFDEVFTPYLYEDADFCYRARLHGWFVYYCPNSEVYHIRSASLRRENLEHVREVKERNKRIFLQRWKPLIEAGKV